MFSIRQVLREKTHHFFRFEERQKTRPHTLSRTHFPSTFRFEERKKKEKVSKKREE